MNNIVRLFCLCFLFLLSETLSAHAVVTQYSLKITPIQANKSDNVTLTFNSKIELGLSQIYLVSTGDKHQLLTAENSSQQGQIIIHVPALDVGDYAIKFKIFAADGHLTEDVIHFTVLK